MNSLLREQATIDRRVRVRAVFYDTETTGLHASTDRIIEIAAYDPANDRSFSGLINPGVPIPAVATSVHHITDDMVSASPSFASVGQQFIDFCSGDVVLIAHNNDGFDYQFLSHECERHSLQMPSSWRFIDSLKWARKYRTDLPSHALQYLRRIYGIEENNAHRALDDVMVLYRVFTAMTQSLAIDDIYALVSS